MLTKLDLFDSKDQNTEIKILESNFYTQVISKDVSYIQKKKKQSLLIDLKGNNQSLIVLTHNIVFYACTKYINI